MKILIVGGGSMGQSFAHGLSSSGNVNRCAVIEKDPVNAQRCEEIGMSIFSSIDEVPTSDDWFEPDVCIIAVKPKDIPAVGEKLKTFLPDNCIVISIAAGISISTLQETLGDYPIVRAMPNIAASQLMSATAICSADRVTETELMTARSVMESLGTVVRVSEEQMNLVTAISGSGPAYFFFLAEQMAEAAQEFGLDVEIAHKLIAQTFLGAATIAKEVGSFATLRERVTSPGGTTQAAIEAFQENGFEKAIFEGIRAALERGEELDSASPVQDD